ncbi:MAG: rhomboid family intramembrane serine protease [Planctomycetes bacterium]|nr:rhomboid family intramembrane serine protease [Planctomycetota bacterium]
MLIPLRTDRPPKRRPVITEALIIVNLLVYLVGVAGPFFDWFEHGAVAGFGHFDPHDFRAWQLVTYQFLHDPGGFGHIAFNMLFLWVFGAAVEDRLGRMGFLGFYLIAGMVAALAHSAVTTNPIIGASGSIAGVTGAFLALFPRSRIKILVFFFLIGVYNIPSLWFIGFYFVIDLLRQLSPGDSNVAYMAHLAGYVYGFGVGFALLALNILKREEFDVFFLFKQAKRRAAFRAASKSGPAGMWSSAQADTSKRLAKIAAKAEPITEREQQHFEKRTEISRLIAAHDLPGATKAYKELLDEAPQAVLAEPYQLDVANQLYADSEHATAASAYELFLEKYASSYKANEVRLILGLIYARRLDKPTQAKALIEQAKSKLRDKRQSALADQLLAELEG